MVTKTGLPSGPDVSSLSQELLPGSCSRKVPFDCIRTRLSRLRSVRCRCAVCRFSCREWRLAWRRKRRAEPEIAEASQNDRAKGQDWQPWHTAVKLPGQGIRLRGRYLVAAFARAFRH